MRLILTSIVTSLVIAGTVFAETINVPGDHLTITQAVASAGPGDTVYIEPGVYAESEIYIGSADLTITGAVHDDGSPAVTIDGSGVSDILIAIGVVGSDGATVENIVFTGSLGNALWIYHMNPVIRNCVFTGIDAAVQGAAIWSSDSEAIIEDCRFVNNDGGSTGSIFFTKSNSSSSPGPTLRGCTFEDNTAYSTVVIQYCNPVIEQCTFESNTSPDFFGATVRMLQSAAMVRDCVFSGNVGSGIGAEHADGLQILDCTFSDNAVAYGGGVRVSGTSGVDSAIISGCSFMNHVSPMIELGAALNSSNIDLALIECEFMGNRGDAGVWFASGGSYDIDRCLFKNNFDGTCASFSSDAAVSMSQCTFIDNSSSGVSIGGFSTASFSECLFENNHATWGPGGILLTQTNTIIDSCEFRANGPVSGSGSGAIYHLQGTLEIVDSLFCENSGDAGDIDGPWNDAGGNRFEDECPADCLGDVTGDGAVNVTDLLEVISAWGSADPNADFDEDGLVDADDVLILLSHFGEACP